MTRNTNLKLKTKPNIQSFLFHQNHQFRIDKIDGNQWTMIAFHSVQSSTSPKVQTNTITQCQWKRIRFSNGWKCIKSVIGRWKPIAVDKINHKRRRLTFSSASYAQMECLWDEPQHCLRLTTDFIHLFINCNDHGGFRIWKLFISIKFCAKLSKTLWQHSRYVFIPCHHAETWIELLLTRPTSVVRCISSTRQCNSE